MQKLTVGSLVVLGSVLAVGACHNRQGSRHAEGHRHHDRDHDHDEHNDEAHSPDVGSGISTKRAVHAIARARCEREKRCDNVGGGKAYASSDACEAKIEAEWAGDLNKYECPHGIVQAALDKCLGDVRAEECGNPVDTLSRIVSCDADDICDGD